MSNKELAKKIIDELPEYKIEKILLFLQGVTFDDELEDERYCENILHDFEADQDPEKSILYSLEECKREWGLSNV